MQKKREKEAACIVQSVSANYSEDFYRNSALSQINIAYFPSLALSTE
jgi:hypothetical protein